MEETYVLIWSNEHTAFWAPNQRGYTSIRSEAGAYPYSEANEICLSANKWVNDAEIPNEAMLPINPDEKFQIQ
jgi:hypothetical protein